MRPHNAAGAGVGRWPGGRIRMDALQLSTIAMHLLRNPFFRVLALVWMAAALLACSAEPQERKAFITLLQTRILDKSDGTYPILTAEDKKQLGETYAQQYAIIQDFNQSLNKSVGKPAQELIRKSSFSSIGDVLKRRDDLKTLQTAVKDLQGTLDQELAKADAARAALKQPEDLKAVYDKAYAKTVTNPATAFKDTFPALDAMFDSVNKVADFVEANKGKVKISGMMLEVTDPKLHQQLNALLNDLNTKGRSLNDAQNKLLKAVRG